MAKSATQRPQGVSCSCKSNRVKALAVLAHVVQEAVNLLDFDVEDVQSERERLLRERLEDWHLQNPCDNCQGSECTPRRPYYEKHEAAEAN